MQEFGSLFSFLFNSGVFWGTLGVITFFVVLGILKMFIKISYSDNIIVINGRKRKNNDRQFGFSVEKGRANIIPFFEESQYLDLSLFPINVRVEGVNSANGITLGADATACVCIDDDNDNMLYAAVEKLMGKKRNEIHEQIQQTLVGNFRGALNKATPLQAIGMEDVKADNESDTESDRAQFRNEMFKDMNNDLSNFGMKVVSVSFQKIWDTSNYIANLAQKTLAQKRQEVMIEEARLRATAEQIESDAKKRITISTNKAEEKIIQAKQKVEVFKQESEASIQKSVLEANNSINEAINRGQKAIEEKNILIQQLKNQSGVILSAKAKLKASEIIAQGLNESVNTKEEANNIILKQKIELLEKSGNVGKMILFARKLHYLFDSYKIYAKDINVDSLLIMDNESGLNGAVNRGPIAFTGFLKEFEKSLGISIKEMLNPEDDVKMKKGE